MNIKDQIKQHKKAINILRKLEQINLSIKLGEDWNNQFSNKFPDWYSENKKRLECFDKEKEKAEADYRALFIKLNDNVIQRN